MGCLGAVDTFGNTGQYACSHPYGVIRSNSIRQGGFAPKSGKLDRPTRRSVRFRRISSLGRISAHKKDRFTVPLLGTPCSLWSLVAVSFPGFFTAHSGSNICGVNQSVRYQISKTDLPGRSGRKLLTARTGLPCLAPANLALCGAGKQRTSQMPVSIAYDLDFLPFSCFFHFGSRISSRKASAIPVKS